MYTIRISDHPAAWSECHSEAHVDTKEDVIVYLWALSKQDIPQYGLCWLPMGIEPMTNINMFYTEPPESLKGKISAITATLNEPDIESLVVQGLNTVYKGICRHSDNKTFVDEITAAAKEWAETCTEY